MIRLRINGDAVNHSRASHHAHAGDAALQSRPCCPGAGNQPAPVAEHNFRIGSHVNQDGCILRGVHAGEQDARYQVASEITANIRKNQNSGQGIHLDSQFFGLHNPGNVHNRNIWLTDDPTGIQAHEEMGHGGVASHGNQIHIIRLKIARVA